MEGDGTTRISQNGLLLASTANSKYLQGRLLNNLGRVAWSGGPANLHVAAPAGETGNYLENPDYIVADYRDVAEKAGNRYLTELGRLRGDPANPAAGSLLWKEYRANQTYTQEEQKFANDYNSGSPNGLASIESDYNHAILGAEEARAARPADDPQADEDYWNRVTQAE